MRIEKNGQVITTVDDWKNHAAPKGRDAQWRELRSAMELANAWCRVSGEAPTEFLTLFDTHSLTKGLRIVSATPEHRSAFDTYGEPRNADLAVIGETDPGRVAVSVEAKADEPYGPTVEKALQQAQARKDAGKGTNYPDRVDLLLKALFPGTPPTRTEAGDLRYQLLSGMAGALVFAREAGADFAVFVVHEFLSAKTSNRRVAQNAADLDVFIRRISGGAITTVKYGELVGPVRPPGSEFVPPLDVLFGKVKTWCGAPPDPASS